MRTITRSTMIVLTGLLMLGILAARVPHTYAAGQAGTTLLASKTATGFFERHLTYDWSLTKSVDPAELLLKPGESATVAYTLQATRTLVSQVDTTGVRGELCVTNGGDRPTEQLKLVDQVQYKTGSGKFLPLPGATATIVPQVQLGPGESACYPYEIVFTPIAGAQYRNTVKVTITNHSGQLGTEFGPEPKADFVMPVDPTIIETDETADLSDVLTCPAGFTCSGGLVPNPRTLTATTTITYTVTVRNDSAACGTTATMPNTATLVETDTRQQRNASANVTISTGECPTTPQGCTPGYWKNHPAAWAATGYAPSQKLSSVFANTGTLGGKTMIEALSFKGGSTIDGAKQILLRASVAALLDAAHPDVNYPRTQAAIIADVSAALASNNRAAILQLAAALDADNNLGCPL